MRNQFCAADSVVLTFTRSTSCYYSVSIVLVKLSTDANSAEVCFRDANHGFNWLGGHWRLVFNVKKISHCIN